jgi:membrane-associated PAP2 superfamily phosphatase
MNRNALLSVLIVAAAVGVVFGVCGNFDISLSSPFFDRQSMLFPAGGAPWEEYSRDAARLIITTIAAVPCVALLGKLLLPGRRMFLGGRAALFMLLTLAIGPGIVTNLVLKSHWNRARPIDISYFGGDDRFTPWWDPRGSCTNNCSFIAGEPSGAFWTLAAAAVAPPQWRILAYGGAAAFGLAVGVLRIAAGGHFFTDVFFAGVITYLLAWLIHGLIFRWHATRLEHQTVEGWIARCGEALRGVLRLRSTDSDGKR